MANESVARKEFSLLGKDSFHVKIRIIALIGLVLDIAILTLELTNVMHANTVKHVTDSITIALLVVLFARPNRTGILAFIGIAQCVINIYYGRITSYNVCYTKLLRPLENVGKVPFAEPHVDIGRGEQEKVAHGP